MARANPRRWRYSTGYHYYEDDKYGYGVVHAYWGGSYVAFGRNGHKVVKTVREGKAFVESTYRRRKSEV